MAPAPPTHDGVTPAFPGGFWPGGTRLPGARQEGFDGFMAVRARHLPTAAALGAARAELGDGSAPALGAWARLWRGLDVGSVAAATGYVEGRDREGVNASRHAARVAGLISEGDVAGAAAEAVAEAASPHASARPVAFHVLEDAVVQVSLAAAGVPLRLLVGNGPGARAWLVAEGGALRHATEAEAEEADGRASVSWRSVNPYWASPAFRREARRSMAVCVGHDHLAATLLDMALQGHARAFLRHAMPKRGTWVVDILGARDLPEVGRRMGASMGLSLAGLHGPVSPANSVLVQGFLPFTHEHRFFCVGHRVVASTPSVRSLSLLDSGGRLVGGGLAALRSPAEAQGPYDRGEADLVHDRAALSEMARGARRLAAGLARERRLSGNYVIDMGMTREGVAAIEVNTLANAGLYAVDYARVARSLGRWYSDPSRRPAPDPVRQAIAAFGKARPRIPLAIRVAARARAALDALREDPFPARAPAAWDGEDDADELLLNVVLAVSRSGARGG